MEILSGFWFVVRSHDLGIRRMVVDRSYVQSGSDPCLPDRVGGTNSLRYVPMPPSLENSYQKAFERRLQDLESK